VLFTVNPNKRFQYQAIGSLQYTRQDPCVKTRDIEGRRSVRMSWKCGKAHHPTLTMLTSD